MKRALLLLAIVSMAAVGCQTHSRMAKNGCQTCGPRGQGQYAGSQQADYVPQTPRQCGPATAGPAGPPSGAYAYPYYTTRGPRDFFLDAPSTIGY